MKITNLKMSFNSKTCFMTITDDKFRTSSGELLTPDNFGNVYVDSGEYDCYFENMYFHIGNFEIPRYSVAGRCGIGHLSKQIIIKNSRNEEILFKNPFTIEDLQSQIKLDVVSDDVKAEYDEYADKHGLPSSQKLIEPRRERSFGWYTSDDINHAYTAFSMANRFIYNDNVYWRTMNNE